MSILDHCLGIEVILDGIVSLHMPRLVSHFVLGCVSISIIFISRYKVRHPVNNCPMTPITGIILVPGSANEGRRYIVTTCVIV